MARHGGVIKFQLVGSRCQVYYTYLHTIINIKKYELFLQRLHIKQTIDFLR